ncbi:MAG: DUF362 domain-containing protein [Candidatus Eisenbacteria bacterium]|nr:DUF362 domain-containing protein [Candidatus Eisenbacteria bacterium]
MSRPRTGHAHAPRAGSRGAPGAPGPRPPHAATRSCWSAWLLALPALLWLAVRSGSKPSRLSYPCQRAALGSVALLLAPALAPALLALVRPLRKRWARASAAACVAVAVAIAAGTSPGPAAPGRGPARDTARPGSAAPGRAAALISEIFAVRQAGGPSGDHHLGVDQLLACMALDSLCFYRSAQAGFERGPDGIVRADGVVLIKVNAQWPERGGTNTDVLKGLIARILEHPDGFTGEVVVVENTQGAGTLDWAQANAEDHAQSAQDVVDHFAALGWPVSSCLWDSLRTRSVGEYAGGDPDNGYVVGDWQADVQMKVSYPKFRTVRGRRVSLKYGLWDPAAGAYDDSLLTFLNLPVLKCHAGYGVTAAVKHHVGTMTTALSTYTHGAVRYGGLGAFLGEVRLPDLNILDAIYVLAIPGAGPAASYAQATPADWLLAGRDPVALDMWATANVLVPAITANGYTSYPMQDPGNPSSIFRTYLDASMSELLERGRTVTNDLCQIDAHVCDGDSIRVDPPGGTPHGTTLSFPNPTAAAVTIRFDLPASGEVRLEVFDAAGALLRTVRRSLGAGPGRELSWDGRDDAGRAVACGSYFYRVSAAGFAATGKIVTVK